MRVQFNKTGQRMGESHGRAKVSDRDVLQIRELYARDEQTRGLSCREIAEKFGISKSQVARIINHESRARSPAKVKTVFKK